MEMSKRDIAKKMTAFVVGAGVTKIVAGVIANNTAPTRVTDKVSIVAAAFVLGGIAADAASKYTDSQIDKIVDFWNENVKKNTETEPEAVEA